jgi:hypothetical protein
MVDQPTSTGIGSFFSLDNIVTAANNINKNISALIQSITTGSTSIDTDLKTISTDLTTINTSVSTAATNIANLQTALDSQINAVMGGNGYTAVANLTGTGETSVLSNANASGLTYKVTALLVSNVNGSASSSITISYHSAAALGGTATEICKTVVVPQNSTLVVIDANSAIYLGANSSLGATAANGNYLKVVCGYQQFTAVSHS